MVKHINPNNKPLTLEKLRTFPGYEHKADAELTHELDNIRKMAEILAGYIHHLENNRTDYQDVVYLNQQNNEAA